MCVIYIVLIPGCAGGFEFHSGYCLHFEGTLMTQAEAVDLCGSMGGATLAYPTDDDFTTWQGAVQAAIPCMNLYPEYSILN